MVNFFRRKNKFGVMSTRPITQSDGEPFKESDMKTFTQSKRPIIRTKEGEEVELLGGGNLIVNGKKMTLEDLKKENSELHSKVLKIAERMGTAAQWLGKGKSGEFEAVVGFKKL